MSPTESSILHPPNISTQGLGMGPCLPGLLTFCNVPWDSSQEHLAGVDGVLVVSGRQLPAPGAGCFVHSLERTPVILSTGSFPSHSPTGLPIFPSYRLSRAAQPQAAALFSLHTLRARVRLGPGANSVFSQCVHRGPPSVGLSPGPLPAHLLPADEAGLLSQY